VNEWIEKDARAPEPPEVRRGFASLAHARGAVAAERSLRDAYRGDVQMHSTWSDGGSSISEMAFAAAQRGYEYIAITDHSSGQRIPQGINEADLREQWREIDDVNCALEANGSRVTVLRGLEMNLTPEGEGDTDPETLAALDLVVGSFHSKLRVTEDQTDRYIAGLRNPDICILGHPRGRRWPDRLGLRADWDRVLAEAAELDKAVEVDSYPDRQDLDVERLQLAREAGVRIAIDTDSHHAPQLEWIDLGIAAALRAGIARDRIINLLPRDELIAWSRSVRRS
jgi:histidinol phosphatase-like PHP family hydrolase